MTVSDAMNHLKKSIDCGEYQPFDQVALGCERDADDGFCYATISPFLTKSSFRLEK
jgi:hypothetical protein